MAGGQVTVRLDTRPLQLLLRAMPGRTRAVVRKNAFRIRDAARAQAHVITGSMRDSIYVNMGQGDSTYVDAVVTARGDNRRAKIEPEVPAPAERFGAIVAVAVEHGYYEEVKRAHKFLLPAAMSVQPAFVKDMSTEIFR